MVGDAWMASVSRRSFLALPLAGIVTRILKLNPNDDLSFLRQMTLEVLEASRIKPGAHGPPNWPYANSFDFSLVTPGKGGYPAFWIRDFSMATDSCLLPDTEIRNHLRLIAKCQNGGDTRALKSGGIVPPYSIPDHINFDGSAVFYPGTYSAGEDQGGEPWGILPPVDDHYEFIHIAHNLWKQSGVRTFLEEDVGQLSILDRLIKAFEAPVVDGDTDLVKTSERRRAVGFGFCDGIYFTGDLLMASLLRWRAAGELADLTGDRKFRTVQQTIQKTLVPRFKDDKSGWLLAATEIGRQPDVWGTLFALHLGILSGHDRIQAQDTVLRAMKDSTITLEGAVRHVPTDRDFSATSAWERTFEAKNTYQNGAYWHTPTGWLLSVLHKIDRKHSNQILSDFVNHLKSYDYRKGGEGNGAPWECFGANGAHAQNSAYLASVALPYSILKHLKL